MRILALDLGTKTGWAVGEGGRLLDCGTRVLATAKDIKTAGLSRMNRKLDPRVVSLWSFLDLLNREERNFDYLVWEDVLFSSTTMQTQLWSSFRTVVWMFAHVNGMQTECLPVQKLKQFGAGHGGATKEMMACSITKYADPRFVVDKSVPSVQFSGKILDDNAADAVHLLHWAMKTFRNK